MRNKIAIALLACVMGTTNAAPIVAPKVCDSCRLEPFAKCEGIIETPVFDAGGRLLVTAPTKAVVYAVNEKSCSVAYRFPHADAMPVAWRYLPDGSVVGVDAAYGTFIADSAGANIKYVGNRPFRDRYPGATYQGLDDLVVDTDGGIYMTDAIGTSILKPTGKIYYRSASGEISEVADGLAFPNGVAISPDRKTLYISEYNAARMVAIPITAPGKLDVSRAFVFFYFVGGRGPDGMTMDGSGNLWIADASGGGQITVLAPNGVKLGELTAPHAIVPTNLTLHEGYVYVTTLSGELWRAKVSYVPMTH